jgi:PadR family transcriptional regulator
MSGRQLRLTTVVAAILDIVANSPQDSPAWGLRLCQMTGYRSGTIYPALDRLMKAGWISDHWEVVTPPDRPPRRYYEITTTGREQYAAELQVWERRRAAWLAGGARDDQE